MEGCLLRHKVGCLAVSMEFWDSDEVSGCFLRLWSMKAQEEVRCEFINDSPFHNEWAFLDE
jgi:hypothetical protein